MSILSELYMHFSSAIRMMKMMLELWYLLNTGFFSPLLYVTE